MYEIRLDYVLYVQDVIAYHRQVQADYGGDIVSQADITGLDM